MIAEAETYAEGEGLAWSLRRLQPRLVYNGKWPIYSWFTMVYLLKMGIFHGCVK
jgi:hypothetical protein